MKERICLTSAIAAVAALALLVPSASASHVQCGDTITTTTTLDSDVACPDGAQYGLFIGADNVRLKLNGFTVSYTGLAGGGVAGIASASPDEDGLQNVEIKRGSVEGFQTGIDLPSIDDSVVLRVNVTTEENQFLGLGSERGMHLVGDRNSVYRSNVTLTDQTLEGILLTGDDAYAWGNTAANTSTTSVANLLVASGERPRLVNNQITGCGPTGSGGPACRWTATPSTRWSNRNTVTGCDTGVSAASLNMTGGGARVALNNTTGGAVGIRVNDTSAIVGRNVAQDASDTGILLDNAGTTVRNNGAYDNGNYGIFGPVGTVDGGGNLASGNGDGTNPQCVNVECSEPPPPT